MVLDAWITVNHFGVGGPVYFGWDILKQNHVKRALGRIIRQPCLDLRLKNIGEVRRPKDRVRRASDSEDIGIADHRPMRQIVLAHVGTVQGIRVVNQQQILGHIHRVLNP